jgi:hypothetical protein
MSRTATATTGTGAAPVLAQQIEIAMGSRPMA